MSILSSLQESYATMGGVISNATGRLLGDYVSPEWIGYVTDSAQVIGAILALGGLIALIAKVVRWLDKKRDTRFAEQVKALVEPIIADATQPIRPGYRNGGESLADVAALAKSTSGAVQAIEVAGERRDQRLERLADVVDTVDRRTIAIEQRQREQDARAERIEKAATLAVATRVAHEVVVQQNQQALWDAVRGLGADLPEMARTTEDQ